MISLFCAISRALRSVFTLNPITITSAPEVIPLMSDSEIGPIPFPTILNSAVSFFILAISFSMASIEPETSAFNIIGIIFLAPFASLCEAFRAGTPFFYSS